MAKVTITLEDVDEHGNVATTVQFEPVIKEEEDMSDAQYAAMIMLGALKEDADSFNVTNISGSPKH